MYFIDNYADQAQKRMSIIPNLKKELISNIQNMLHEKNNYVKSFKHAKDRIQGPECRLVIRAEKTPRGEHNRRLNAPISNGVEIIFAGETECNRDIIRFQLPYFFANCTK